MGEMNDWAGLEEARTCCMANESEAGEMGAGVLVQLSTVVIP